MNLSRRCFISLGASVASAVAAPRLFAKQAADFDPALTVFFSDVHINGVANGPDYQRERFAAAVASVLKMDPLPARAVVFGDLAWLYGKKKDYEASAPLLKQLTDAGIRVTVGMGNHDRRADFLEVHPEQAKTTRVPGRIVSDLSIGSADLIMLDTLQEGPDPNKMGPVPGALNDEQQAWLAAELPKRKRPVFVCAHHPVQELRVNGKPLSKLLITAPAVAGYIYGHNHKWKKDVIAQNWTSTNLKRCLCLPSTGHWGDIGYTLFRTTRDRAVATLVQTDFFYPSPCPADRRPPLWDILKEENRGATCTFLYPTLSPA